MCITFRSTQSTTFDRFQSDAMDLTTIIITIFTIADELIKLCKEVKQCQREAVRIELRVHNLVGTLESAAGAFCGDIAFEKKLLKLRKFMNTLSPLLEKANYCTNMMDKAKQMANVSTLAKALQREEAILSAMCDDLGLAMLPSIAEKLNELPDKLEARVSVAMEAYFSVALQAAMQEQEDKTEKMLRRTISAYVRQLLVENDSSHTEGTCRGTTSGTGENISKTTSRPGHNGGSSRGVVGSGDTVGAGGGVPFCKGHNRKCVLRTVRKKASITHVQRNPIAAALGRDLFIHARLVVRSFKTQGNKIRLCQVRAHLLLFISSFFW